MTKRTITFTVLASLVIITAPAFAEENSNQDQAESDRRGPPPFGRAGHGGHAHGPRLSEEQRACLDGILGKPGEGARPSHEQMDAAMSQCGVPKPPKGGRPPRSEQGSEPESGAQSE